MRNERPHHRPGLLARFRANNRQRRYPAEFRIAEPDWPSGLREELLRLIATAPKERSDPGSDAYRSLDDDQLADPLTSLWRARRKLAAEPDGNRSVRQSRSQLDRAWRALADAGVAVHDHDNTPFDPGQALRVVAYQPMPGLSRPTVIDTISPTIYIKGRHVQMGQVIVGSPEENSE